MKLVSFRRPCEAGGGVAVGVVAPTGDIVDAARAYQRMLQGQGLGPEASHRIAVALLPGSMVEFIEGGSVTLRAAAEALAWGLYCGDGEGCRWPWAEVTRLCPVPSPPLIRDFMTFEEHLQNIYPKLGRAIPPEWYEMPVYYKGNPASTATDGDPVVCPADTTELDLEFELALVIGKTGRDIGADAAMSYVYGYMIYNDFSARTIQSREMAVGLGPAKGKDFVGAHVFGPWLVTKDEIPDIYNLSMEARINDEVWCQSNSGTMHWRIPDMIAHASRDEMIRAGEIWGFGTVGGGSGLERGTFLKPGDVVQLRVDRLGILENQVVAPRQ